MRRGKSSRGTTLVEILIAVTFLAVCAAATLQVVGKADTQGAYAIRRTRILGALENQIQQLRGNAQRGALVAGVSDTKIEVPGIEGDVSLHVVANLQSGSRTLFDVAASATWIEHVDRQARADSATLTTVIRQ